MAEWLAREMEKQDRMSKSKLQELSGVDRKTIQKVLDGTAVRVVCLRKLASAFDVPFSDIPTE